jgi:hypothetical protein
MMIALAVHLAEMSLSEGVLGYPRLSYLCLAFSMLLPWRRLASPISLAGHVLVLPQPLFILPDPPSNSSLIALWTAHPWQPWS